MRRGDIAIVACRNGVESAKILCSHLSNISKKKMDIVKSESKDFMDGEVLTKLRETVRGKDVFIIQNTLNPAEPDKTSHNIMELLLMIDNVKRSEATHITVVLPYLSYSKQERRQGRQPISVKLLIDMMETAGAEKLLTMDLHAPATEGFSRNVKIQNLYASGLLLEYFAKKKFSGVFLAPDPGAGKNVRYYSKVSGLDMALGYKYKRPDSTHDFDEQKLLGDVKDMDVTIIDDQTAGSGTLINMAKTAKKHGANYVYAGVTHAMFLGDANKNFTKANRDGVLKELVITNTLIHSKDFLKKLPFVTVLDSLKIFAQAIHNIHTEKSISELYSSKLRKVMFG